MFKTKLTAGLDAVFALTGKEEGGYVEAADLTKINTALADAAKALEAKDADAATIADLNKQIAAGADAVNAKKIAEDALATAKTASDKVTADFNALQAKYDKLAVTNAGPNDKGSAPNDGGHGGGETRADKYKTSVDAEAKQLN